MEPTTSEHPEASPEAVNSRYEPMRLSGRGLRYFVFWFVLALALTFPLIWVVMKHLMTQNADDLPQSVVQPADSVKTPSSPLQPSAEHDTLPREDLALMHERENSVFEHLGWKVDRRTGVPTIPQAIIEAVRQRESSPATTRPTTVPTAPRTAEVHHE
jgi:hypothetical protein